MRILKTLSVLLVSLCFPTALSAQGIGDLFINMPDELVPYLNQSMRKEMVEMYRYGVDSSTKNKFDDISSIDTLSVDYGRFKLSSSKTLELMVLPSESDTLICAVSTIKGPSVYGNVDVYDLSWNHLNASDFLPQLDLPMELVAKPDDMTDEKYKELLKNLDPYFVEYNVLPESKGIEVFLSLVYDTKEKKQEISAVMCKRKLIWSGKIFN